MNVNKEFHVVNKIVSILKAHIFVSAIEDTHYIVMEEHVLVSSFKVLICFLFVC